MNRIKNKIIIDNEDDDIIDNNQEIENFYRNNKIHKYNSNLNSDIYFKNNLKISKEFNNLINHKSPKMSFANGKVWTKAKYQKEKKNIYINKTDSRTTKNHRKIIKSAINIDDIPVGGLVRERNMAKDGTDFNIEIRVPSNNNRFSENKYDNFENCKRNDKEVYLKKNNIIKSNINKNNDNITNKNKETNEMERKNSSLSIITTQTCDREMVGKSEFISIPNNQNYLSQNNIEEIKLNENIPGLNDEKKHYFSINNKSDNLEIKNNSNCRENLLLNSFNYSNANRLTDYNIINQNIRTKTESTIQLQNVQKELDNEIESNKRLKEQVDNYKGEINKLKEELNKKNDIINELQQKISKLENELLLKGNQLIEMESKLKNDNHEVLMKDYEEMKKNYENSNERIKNLSDENEALKEKNMKLEENNKKLMKENKINKEKLIYMNNNIIKLKLNNENDYKKDNDYNSEYNQYINKYEVINNESQKENKTKKINNNEKNQFYFKINNNYINHNNINDNNIKETKNIIDNIFINNENRKEMNNKRYKIPEDNDIFGTRNLKNDKNVNNPRKKQEDGIPVIKRMEEKDNVKDIMINNYTANDDDYYNRAPIGKSKPRRIKTNNKYININIVEDLNSYRGKKNYKSKIINLHNNTNDYIYGINNDTNNSNRFLTLSNNNTYRGIIDGVKTQVETYPNILSSIENENKKDILKLESELFNLQKERDWVNDEYLKYPEYPKKREEINAKRKIEIKLEEMDKKISLQMLKIRELQQQQ